MHNNISSRIADDLDGKEISVKEFLATDWTDHVYLVPSDRMERKGWPGILISNNRSDSTKILKEKYINYDGIYIVREKDFGDNHVGYWIYFGVIVSPEEYDVAVQEERERLFGGE